MQKKIVSLALSLALLFSMVYVGLIGLATTVGAAEILETGLSEISLDGYKKITIEDINTSSGYRIMNQDNDGDDNLWTVTGHKALDYAGSFGGKTYLDVDMNFGGATGNGAYALSWQGNEKYRNSFYLYMYGGTNFVLAHYDASQTVSTLCQATPAAHGVTNSGYFNVKLATDIEKASVGATTETVTWHLWVNDIYVDGGKFSEDAHTRSIFTTGQAAGLFTMRVPKILEEEFEGYEKISLSDFHTGNGSTTAISAQPAGTELTGPNNGVGLTQRYYNGATVESASTYSLDKTYFDFDVNLASSTNAPMYALYERANWYSYLRIKFNNASNQLTLDYVNDDASVTTALGTYNLVAFGRTATNEFFNLKVRSDFKANSSDATLRDAVIQLWINNRFATEVNLTATNMRDGIWFRPGGETTYVREQKDINEELDGYRRVDMFDYGNKTVGADGVTSFAVSDHADSYITDFDKTYLDVDVNYNGNVTWGSHMLQYQASAKYKYAIYLGFDSSSKFCLNNYKNASSQLGTKYTFDASEYGIAPNEYFNIKVRTDITNTSATVDTVLVQLWLNNNYAGEYTMTFTYAEDVEHDKSHIWTASAAINVKSAVDTATQLDGYNRLVGDDFDNIGASVAIEGTSYAAGVAGEYTGNTSDLKNSYVDVDLKIPSDMNPFMAWPSKNKTTTGFYGDGEQIRFYMSGTSLYIGSVHGGLLPNADKINLGDISVAPYNYSPSEFVNLKVKTTVYGANSLGIAVWVNDQFLNKALVTKYDAATLADMTCLGIRGTNATTNCTYARTPLNGAKLLNLEYNLAHGNYLLKGWPTFRVNGTTMSSGEVLSAPGDYNVEYMLDGEPVASRTISLYKLGDTNLDGSAFVAGDSVYKDAYTTVGMLKYGAVTRASVLAADLNNDGVLNEADSALFMAVKADVSKVDSIVGVNYGDSIGFNYEGGKNVMPIGGYYGPDKTADITDAMFSTLKNSGINMITYQPTKWGTGNDRDILRLLALAEKYGIGVYITDPSTNVLTKDENDNVTAQTTVSTASELANAMAQYGIYDSVIGLEVIGEPKPSTGGDYDANYYKRYKYYDDLLGTLKDYSNVSGGYVLQGAGAYERGDYTIVDEVDPDVDYYAFDSYLYLESNDTIKGYKRNAYFETLDTMRKKSIDNSKPFWSYVSAGCDFRDDGSDGATGYYCTEADILWNVNTSLAFGAKGITYFPMIQPEYFARVDKENNQYDYNRNGIIGADGNTNRYYPMVQRANTQISAVDDVLMNADSKGVITVGNAASDMTTAASQRNYTFSGILSKTGGKYTDKLSNVTASKSAGAMVGAFDYHSSEAYYVVNYDTTENATQTITLTFGDSQDVTVIKDGVKTTYNSVSTLDLTLDSGEGALIILEDYNDVVIDGATASFTLSEAGTVNDVAKPTGYEITACGVYTVQYANGSTYNVVIYKVGDITADGSIDIRDIIKLKKYLTGSVTLNKSGINALQSLNQATAADQLTALINILLGR